MTSGVRPQLDREAGFTLVELVAVVVIMLVLVGITMSSFTVSRSLPPARAAVSTAQTLAEAVWAFQRDHEGRVPASPSRVSEWSWVNGPMDFHGRPYTPQGARPDYRDRSVEICFAAVDAPQTPTDPDHTCGGAGNSWVASDVYARVVYTPRRGAGGALDGYRIDVYTRRSPSDAFSPSSRACTVARHSIDHGTEKDTC